jgi:hypothetical protein
MTVVTTAVMMKKDGGRCLWKLLQGMAIFAV